jgi:hypothetical protein
MLRNSYVDSFDEALGFSITTMLFLEASLSCQQCEFPQSRTFAAEVNIHFPGYEGLTRRTVWVFPQVLVCPNCGFAQFSIPESELQRLVADEVDVVPQVAD